MAVIFWYWVPHYPLHDWWTVPYLLRCIQSVNISRERRETYLFVVDIYMFRPFGDFLRSYPKQEWLFSLKSPLSKVQFIILKNTHKNILYESNSLKKFTNTTINSNSESKFLPPPKKKEAILNGWELTLYFRSIHNCTFAQITIHTKSEFTNKI